MIENDLQKLRSFQMPHEANEAITFAYKILEEHPNHPEVHFTLGFLFEIIKDFDKSLEHHQACLKYGAHLFPHLDHDFEFDKVSYDEENIPCPLCDSPHYKPVRVVNALPLSYTHKILNPIRIWCQCQECQQLFVSPRQTLKAIAAYADKEAKRLFDVKHHDKYDIERETDRLNFLIHACPDLNKNDSLLDIGASYGHFLKAALSKGFNAYGIELTENKSGLILDDNEKQRLILGNVETHNFQGQKYDLICAFDLIEHVIDVQGFVHKVKSLLKQQGYFFISTPIFDSKIAQEEGFGHVMWLAIEHLIYFNHQGLITFIENFGFKHVTSRQANAVRGGVESIFRLES